MKTNSIMYPQVSQLGVGRTNEGSDVSKNKGIQSPGEAPSGPSEFEQVFSEASKDAEKPAAKDLNEIKQSLKFSSHATSRMKDRKIQLDPSMMAKVNKAIDMAQSKGLEDTLVLTPNAALIVNVPNRTVVTAMDRAQLQGNVFTNIDGAVVV